jgi:hypothetical protein
MENTLLMAVSGLFSGLVSFLLEIALLVVALGPVQKHRPEASTLLATSAGLGLLTTILYYPATMLLPSLLAPDSMRMGFALVGILTTLLRGTGQVLLLLGVLRLAVPVSRDPTRYG